jgi:tetratricopeptide (TPR) repeat protein
MKNTIIFSFLIFFCSAFSCNQSGSVENTNSLNNSDSKTLLKEIDKLEAKLRKAKLVTDEMPAARELVKKSQSFSEIRPQDKKTAAVLFKAADVARGIGEYGKAIQLWGKVWRNYPDFDKAPDAVFMQAFTYENNLGDIQNAKRYYLQFIEKFPKNPLREQAIIALKNLGKSPEDLIKEFQKNEKK